MRQAGFAIDSFGENSFAVRSVPAYLDSGDVQSVISELAEKAMNSRTTVPDRLDDLIHTVACKAAIKDQNTMLEELYAKFNVSRPDDFTGHSLSVSDIVALRQNGVVSCHYVDSIGFQELPGFLKPENYLKAAEMAMEDDYGMIDGVINNGKKEEPVEKASVLDQLKEKQEAVPPAPPRRCCEEKEL